MDQRHLRVLYAMEFLLALIAVFTVWSQVGGQGHLDQMHWLWKLGLGVAISYAAVKATAAAVAGERTWNARSLRWLSTLLALAATAVFVTYYYHVYEPLEEEAVPEETAALPGQPACRKAFLHGATGVLVAPVEEEAVPEETAALPGHRACRKAFLHGATGVLVAPFAEDAVPEETAALPGHRACRKAFLHGATGVLVAPLAEDAVPEETAAATGTSGVPEGVSSGRDGGIGRAGR